MSEISDELRAELDELKVSTIAEYLGERLQLGEGTVTLKLVFKEGRYERMKRFAAAP